MAVSFGRRRHCRFPVKTVIVCDSPHTSVRGGTLDRSTYTENRVGKQQDNNIGVVATPHTVFGRITHD